LLHHDLSGGGVIPEIGNGSGLAQFAGLALEVSEVKDAPEAWLSPEAWWAAGCVSIP